MRQDLQGTTSLGELVAAAFDGARRYSTDPLEVSRLATQVVERVVRRARGRLPPPAEAARGGPRAALH